MPTFASPEGRRRRRWWSAWPLRTAAASALAAGAVFAVLDVVDVLLCLVYALLDGILEESPVGCYCHRSYDSEASAATDGGGGGGDGDDEVSDTLYARRSAVRDALAGLVRVVVAAARTTKRPSSRAPPPEEKKWRSPRWSDCGCKSCVAWRAGAGAGRLHVAVKEPAEPKGSSSTTRDSSHLLFPSSIAAVCSYEQL